MDDELRTRPIRRRLLSPRFNLVSFELFSSKEGEQQQHRLRQARRDRAFFTRFGCPVEVRSRWSRSSFLALMPVISRGLSPLDSRHQESRPPLLHENGFRRQHGLGLGLNSRFCIKSLSVARVTGAGYWCGGTSEVQVRRCKCLSLA